MRRAFTIAALLVASVTADEEGKKGELIVCVESAAFLADLDISESSTSDGSDPFVGVFIGDELYTTTPQADASAPAWNECFKAKGGAKYDVSTDISFVVVDICPGGEGEEELFESDRAVLVPIHVLPPPLRDDTLGGFQPLRLVVCSNKAQCCSLGADCPTALPPGNRKLSGAEQSESAAGNAERKEHCSSARAAQS